MSLSFYTLTSMAKVFLDEAPDAYMKISRMSALKNEKAAFQFCFSSDDFLSGISFEASAGAKVYSVLSAPAVKAADKNTDSYYLRTSPGLYPDILKPYGGGELSIPAGLWFSFWIECENLPSGKNEIQLKLYNGEKETIAEAVFIIDIIDAELPEQKLIYTNWFHCDSLALYYNVPVFSEEFWSIAENFIKTAAEHGMNFILTPLFTPPLDTKEGEERLTVQLIGIKKSLRGWEFDFTKLRRWIRMCLDCRIKYFEMSHLFTQWGALHAPKITAEINGEEKRIFGWDTDSAGEEYTEFLTALAPELTKVLEDEGIASNTYFHISDEPGENDIEAYGKASELIHRLFGEKFKIFDALSDFEFYKRGLVSIPVPNESSIEDFYGKVPELWTYCCCGPTDGFYSNRFLSMPLQRTRVLGFQLYKYGVTGFLHWGFNYYFTRLSQEKVNPFAETDSGCAFSAGDAFIVYPGPDGTPWASLRLKAVNEAFQDMRAMQLLESKTGKAAVLELLENNCGEKFNLTFSNYPRSEKWHFDLRQAINEKIKELI